MAFALGAVTGWAIHRLVRRSTGDEIVAAGAALATTAAAVVRARGVQPGALRSQHHGCDDGRRRRGRRPGDRRPVPPGDMVGWSPQARALGLASTTVLTTIAPTVRRGSRPRSGRRRASPGRSRRALRPRRVGRRRVRSRAALVRRPVVGRNTVPDLLLGLQPAVRFDAAPLLDRVGEAAIASSSVTTSVIPTCWPAPLAVLVVARWLARSAASAMAGRPVRAGVVLVAWWAGEVVSVAAPGRWFGHYWVLLAVPAAALGGLVVGTMRARPRSPFAGALPGGFAASTAFGAVAIAVVSRHGGPTRRRGRHDRSVVPGADRPPGAALGVDVARAVGVAGDDRGTDRAGRGRSTPGRPMPRSTSSSTGPLRVVSTVGRGRPARSGAATCARTCPVSGRT